MVVVGGTVKITSAPGPDPLILIWNRLEWTRNDQGMDQERTRYGPGMDLD